MPIRSGASSSSPSFDSLRTTLTFLLSSFFPLHFFNDTSICLPIMRFSLIISLVAILVVSSLAAAAPALEKRQDRPILPAACSTYDGEIDQNWDGPAELIHDVSQGGNLEKFSYVDVTRVIFDAPYIDTEYTYTIRAGTGKLAKSELFVESVRSKGKGLGQQFIVSFYDKKDVKLVSYWITPNFRCTTQSPFNADAVGKIVVHSRF